MGGAHINKYYDPVLTEKAIASGQHRGWVGGMWDEIGALQFGFLKGRGLAPPHRLLDVGCGCFRAGVHLIEYLDAGRYFGIDISRELLDAGYQRELVPRGLDTRLPRKNLLCSGDFAAADFGVPFDVAIAQSVFTHLPLNHLRQCLARLAPAMAPGGVFYATAFICPDDRPLSEPFKHQPGGITTQAACDPFHYSPADFEFAARGLPWRVELIGDWGHPRNQSMIAFHRAA